MNDSDPPKPMTPEMVVRFLHANMDVHIALIEKMEHVQPSIELVYAHEDEEHKREGKRPRFMRKKFAALLKRLKSLPADRRRAVSRLHRAVDEARRLKKRYDKVRKGKGEYWYIPALHEVPAAQFGEGRVWPRPTIEPTSRPEPGNTWQLQAIRDRHLIPKKKRTVRSAVRRRRSKTKLPN